MAWMIREEQLDPDQREFINVESKRNGNIWIKGFAGSGKSVLLVHALRDLLRENPGSRVAIVVYTKSLVDMFKTGLAELNLPNVPVLTYIEFVDRDTSNYDYLFCDEVQDLPKRVLYAMNNRSSKVIVAGDSNQSIYESDPRWDEPVVNPNEVGELISARAFQLKLIHRLTRSIISAVQNLIPGMNIWNSARDTTKADVNIRLCEARNEGEEVEYVYTQSTKATAVRDSSAILLPRHDYIKKFISTLLDKKNKPQWIETTNRFGKPDYGAMNTYLRQHGLKIHFIGNGYGSLSEASSNGESILMTYHSSKGLDFDNVFLPFVNNNLDFGRAPEHTLMMVAITRSRKNLYLTYCGYTHDLIDTFKSGCTKIDISMNGGNTNATAQSNTFDF